DLSGKHALVLGVANHRSLAWAITQALHQAGASLCLTYAGERLQKGVEELAATLPGALVQPCDVTDDAQIDAVSRKLMEKGGSGGGVGEEGGARGLVRGHVARRLPHGTRGERLLAGERDEPCAAVAREARRRDRVAHLPRRRASRAELQRHGQRQGGARAGHAP